MITGILFVQAVAFAVLSAIIASNKNRDPFGWGAIGFFFGFFGFVAAIAVGEPEPDEESTSEGKKSQPSSSLEFNPDEYEKKCPMCAEYIKLEARRCKHCRHEMSEGEVEQQIEERKQKVERKREKRREERRSVRREPDRGAKERRICPTCETPSPLDQTECPRCGTDLTE